MTTLGRFSFDKLSEQMRDWVQLVRMYMRDHAELNRLLAEEESKDRMIVFALLFTLDEINALPPYKLTFGPSQIPVSLLLLGAVKTLLESAAMLYARNELRYSDGGIEVDLNKANSYQSMAQVANATFQSKARDWKTSVNVSLMYGGAPSEYSLLSWESAYRSW